MTQKETVVESQPVGRWLFLRSGCPPAAQAVSCFCSMRISSKQSSRRDPRCFKTLPRAREECGAVLAGAGVVGEVAEFDFRSSRPAPEENHSWRQI